MVPLAIPGWIIKALAVSGLCFALSSCTIAHGTGQGYTFAALGTDARDIQQTGQGWGAAEVKNSAAFHDVAKAVQWSIIGAAAGKIAGEIGHAYRSGLKTTEATKVKANASAADVEKARISAENPIIESPIPTPTQ